VLGQKRHEAVSDPVSRNAKVPVARIGAESLAKASQERDQFVPPDVQQRADHGSSAWPDAGQASRAGAAQHAKEERLGLVVSGVPGRNAVDLHVLGGIGEEVITGPAGRDFSGHVLLTRQLRHVAAAHLDGDAEPGGQFPAEGLIRVALVAAQAVVQVRNAGHGEAAVIGDIEEQAQQGDRVGPARHGSEHP
jgi:hypothetical protein